MSWSRRADPRAKSMGSYELFSWHDACAVAELLSESFDLPTARRLFEEADAQSLRAFEKKYSRLIAEFIGKAESRREAFLRKISENADDEARITFLVLAIIGLIRVRDVIELRDQYRYALTPGSGNRMTAASIYEFSNEVERLFDYRWPAEVFEALGQYDGVDPGPDGDDDESGEECDGAPTGDEGHTPPSTPPLDLLIYIAKSVTLRLDREQRIVPAAQCPNGKEVYWLGGILDGYQGLRARLFEDLPDAKTVAGCISEALRADSTAAGQRVTVAISPGALKTFGELGAHLGSLSDLVHTWSDGVARRAEGRWLERCLADVTDELALFHENPPTIEDTRRWATGDDLLWSVMRADPKGSFFERKTGLERLVESTLSARSRIPATTEISTTTRWFSNPDDAVDAAIKKRKKLEGYAARGELNNLGEGLWGILELLKMWRDGQGTIAGITSSLGERVLHGYLYSLGDSGNLGWEHHVESLAPNIMLEADLIHRAVFEQLRQGIPLSWFPDSMRWRVTDDRRANQEITVRGFWVRIAAADVAGVGALNGVPRHKMIGRRIADHLGLAGCAVKVDAQFSRNSQFGPPEMTWTPTWYPRWPVAVNTLAAAATSPRGSLAKAQWFTGSKDEKGQRVLLTMLVPTSVKESVLMEKTKLLPQLLEQEINAVMRENGHAEVVETAPEVESFEMPYLLNAERLRLLMGE